MVNSAVAISRIIEERRLRADARQFLDNDTRELMRHFAAPDGQDRGSRMRAGSTSSTSPKDVGTSVEQIERFYARRLPLSKEMAINLQSLGSG